MPTSIEELKRQIGELKVRSGQDNKIIKADSGNEYEIRSLSPWMSIKFGMRLGAGNITAGKTPSANEAIDDDLIEKYMIQTLLSGMVSPCFSNKNEVQDFIEILPMDAILLFQEISLLTQAGGDINLSGFLPE